MADIVKIVIKGSSGYCRIEEAFNDKIIITSSSISYEYIPYMETEINPVRKWSYKTTSPIFKMKYDELVAKLSEIITSEILFCCTDIGDIEFNITYSDKTKWKNTFCIPGDFFDELFKLIRSMVPECEYTPAVLLTSKDVKD